MIRLPDPCRTSFRIPIFLTHEPLVQRLFSADFLQGVLTDSPAHEFPLSNLCHFLQLLIRGNNVTLAPVLNRLELKRLKSSPSSQCLSESFPM
jgi:hypothetical protein